MHSRAWIRLTSFRYTGATAKSVLSCANRFSITGCPLYASNNSRSVSARSFVIKGNTPSPSCSAAKAAWSISHLKSNRVITSLIYPRLLALPAATFLVILLLEPLVDRGRDPAAGAPRLQDRLHRRRDLGPV